MVIQSEARRATYQESSINELHAAIQAAQQATDRLNAAINRVGNGGVETHRLPTANLLRIVLQRTIEGESLDEDCEKLIAVLSKATGGQDLNSRPAKKGPCLPDEGYYRHEGDFVKVQISQSSGKPYAKMWIGDPETQQGKWEYHSGLYFKLRGAVPLSAEDAKAFGDLYHHCIFCGLELTDDRSITAGYGPTCADNRGLPWG